jgi:hypothetical protein
VRSLAQRSGQIAREIKTLISASVERVDEGTALVVQAGSTMTDVVNSIQRVTDIVTAISAASDQQRTLRRQARDRFRRASVNDIQAARLTGAGPIARASASTKGAWTQVLSRSGLPSQNDRGRALPGIGDLICILCSKTPRSGHRLIWRACQIGP